MSEPEERHRARDEVLKLPEGMAQELDSLGMFRWHLERAVFWALRLRWNGGEVRRALREQMLIQGVPEPTRGAHRRLTVMMRARVLARDGLRCQRCGSGARLHVDHIRPVAHGGSDALENLQTLCESCNCSKKDRLEAA